MKDRYQEGLIQADSAVDFEVVAPWVGHSHTVNIQITGVHTQASLLQIIKSSIADFVIFEVDPNDCAEHDFSLLDQHALRAGDKINVVWNNPDDLAIVVDTTLESA